MCYEFLVLLYYHLYLSNILKYFFLIFMKVPRALEVVFFRQVTKYWFYSFHMQTNYVYPFTQGNWPKFYLVIGQKSKISICYAIVFLPSLVWLYLVQKSIKQKIFLLGLHITNIKWQDRDKITVISTLIQKEEGWKGQSFVYGP